MEQSRQDKEWIKKLKTGREDVVLQTLLDLRDAGNNYLLPEIMAVLKKPYCEEVENAVYNILNDLNEQSSVDTFMENLPDYENEDCFHHLISSCWQNGLDYSKHLAYFINVALKMDYKSSFEALTVIEENINQLEDLERENLVSKIELTKLNLSEEKKTLLHELQSIIHPKH
ncbi:MAG: hypothetical protein ACOCZL_02795 [Bacteroidota bacterium]